MHKGNKSKYQFSKGFPMLTELNTSPVIIKRNKVQVKNIKHKHRKLQKSKWSTSCQTIIARSRVSLRLPHVYSVSPDITRGLDKGNRLGG